jgi:putative endonuclease
MFYTYILRSLKDGGYYFGHCSDMQERLNKHNSGKVRSTKARTPFLLHYNEEFQTKSEAFKREMFFKSLEGRQWLKIRNII